MYFSHWLTSVRSLRRATSARFNQQRRPRFVDSAAIRAEVFEQRTLLSVTWVEQGPGPILDGQVQGLTDQSNPVAGDIAVFAPHPSNPDVIFAGAVNGGIWKTTNARVDSPTWTPLTEHLPSLSISALAFSPLDTSTLYAGTGSFSSYNQPFGKRAVGIYKTTDNGSTWSQFGASTFGDLRISSVVPTSIITEATGKQIVLAATFDGSVARGGVYRSSDGGETWDRISGVSSPLGIAGNQLPDRRVTRLIGDPTDPNRFYAGVPGLGVFRSTNGGVTWTSFNNNSLNDNDGADNNQNGTVDEANEILSASTRIDLSLHTSDGQNVLYAALITPIGNPQGQQLPHIFRFDLNSNGNWIGMGTAGGAGSQLFGDDYHFSFRADKTTPNRVIIAGGGHPAGGIDGITTGGGIITRGILSGGTTTWEPLVGIGADPDGAGPKSAPSHTPIHGGYNSMLTAISSSLTTAASTGC